MYESTRKHFENCKPKMIDTFVKDSIKNSNASIKATFEDYAVKVAQFVGGGSQQPKFAYARAVQVFA